MKKQFYIAGYIGEGARRMLSDLQSLDNVNLIDKVIANKFMRVVYYRLDAVTNHFQKAPILKKIFYPWFTLMRIKYAQEKDNYILFFNSGFCREYDILLLEKLKSLVPNGKFILYIVDPMIGFHEPGHWDVIHGMDLVYSINKNDCEKYGFRYYPLIYSKEKPGKDAADRNGETDLYYLGSGKDRTEQLEKIYRECQQRGVKADFHVLGAPQRETEGIEFHSAMIPYEENLKMLLLSNCILEVMHQGFDNPTQRYNEAVAYNKKLLTNNEKTSTFDFYDPRYIRIFHSMEEIDFDFVKEREPVEYGYQNQLSPVHMLDRILEDI